MKKDFKIAVLAGDGIGPEISAVGVDVMTAVCEKFGHKVSYEYAVCGADAIDKVGDPFPEATYQACKNADAVLFSAVGDPKFDNDPTAKVRPEQGLLAMRKKLGLFANIRPVQTFKCLLHKSPLRKELVEGADFIYAKNWSCPGVTRPADYGKVLNKDMSWTVDTAHMAVTNNAFFMHCLPVRRNMIVTDDVIESPQSLVIPEAANREISATVVLKRMLGAL